MYSAFVLLRHMTPLPHRPTTAGTYSVIHCDYSSTSAEVIAVPRFIAKTGSRFQPALHMKTR